MFNFNGTFNSNGIEDFTFDYASYASTNTVCSTPLAYLHNATVVQQIPCSPEQIVYTSDDGVSTAVMPKITDVKVIKEKVVIVSFSDGTQEKSVCSEGDVFSVENGVTICLMKKLLADKCHVESGTSIYNKLVKMAMKEVGASEKKKQEEKEKIRAEKRARKETHDKESKKKRDNRKYLIDICAEALKKAIADTQEDKMV